MVSVWKNARSPIDVIASVSRPVNRSSARLAVSSSIRPEVTAITYFRACNVLPRHIPFRVNRPKFHVRGTRRNDVKKKCHRCAFPPFFAFVKCTVHPSCTPRQSAEIPFCQKCISHNVSFIFAHIIQDISR